MPFEERSRMTSRIAFCREASLPDANVRACCRRFGISQTTGYKWLARYAQGGEAALEERSRRPAHSPARTPPDIEARVLALRRAHPAWGGRKISALLERELGFAPAPSTVTKILRRHGLLDGPGAGEPRAYQRFEHAEPNDLWQMDYKGHFALAAGGRCHPLTVTDDHSRFALVLEACCDQRGATVRHKLERAFEEYGLPLRMLFDNGPPWGTGGPERFTPLTVWLMDLDIRISRGRPYHPQTQGKEERFHGTIQREILDRHAFATLEDAQDAFDAWRRVYNTVRPHEGIGLRRPADRYRPSRRPMPKKIEEPRYGPDDIVRKVQNAGRIHLRGRQLPAPRALVGKPVALRATDIDGVFTLRYRNTKIATIDLRQAIVQPVHDVREHPSTMSNV
jgi:transposase InsO family protein